MHRRAFLKSAAAAASLGAAQATGPSAFGAATGADDSLIRRENAKPGARDWQFTRVRLDRAGGVSGVRSSAIEGYCSKQSVLAGETLDVFVSTRPASRFTLEIFRTGYYGGAGARLMTTVGPLQGETQADPAMGEARVHECRWKPSTTLKIPADWPSGVYLGRLTTVPETRGPYWQSYVIFVVRDKRRASLLVEVSDNTWQA